MDDSKQALQVRKEGGAREGGREGGRKKQTRQENAPILSSACLSLEVLFFISHLSTLPPSLQAYTAQGEWTFADPIPGTLLVNIGDMLSQWYVFFPPSLSPCPVPPSLPSSCQ